jgi:Tfp pilus assembly protein PilN
MMKNNASSLLSLTAHHFESHPRYSFWGARISFWKGLCKSVVLMLVIGWLVYECVDIIKTQQTIQLLSSQEQDVSQQSLVLKAKQQKQNQLPTAVLTPTQIRGYNSVIRQLNVPWKEVFSDLEAMTPMDVALISIEPDGSRSMLKLVAEAKSLSTLLSYSSKLQQNGIFGRIAYSKHETNEQDANKPIRLSFELELRQSELDINTLSSSAPMSKVGQR